MNTIQLGRIQKVLVVGLGYIGLPTAALLASRKISVVGLDVNPKTIDTINQGKIHIIEPDLDILVHATVHEKFLRATLVPEPADVILIAVPTPMTEDHKPDVTYIEKACQAIAPILKKGDLIILESTSPVGTTEKMSHWLSKECPHLSFPHHIKEASDIRIAYCPERVLPGRVLTELVHNDRVIGGISPACSEKALEFYRLFVEGECLLTDSRTAEMCKLTENSFRDVNIAFANELSIICDSLGISVWELIRLANHHPRVNILRPGPGVGGHCLAVDPWFIINQSPSDATLIRAAREVNDRKIPWVLEQVKKALAHYHMAHPEKQEKDIIISCFGVTFKPDTDDIRESPALKIVSALADFHAGMIFVVDPHIQRLPLDQKNIELVGQAAALEQCDIPVFLVNHKAFKTIHKPNHIYVDVQGLWSDF